MMERISAALRKSGEWIAPIAAVAMVFVMLVPLPSFMLDLLLTISITASILVLLTAIQILRPVQFSVFPSLLLLLTLLRLSLDLAGTRRILLHGNEGTAAAGKVIESFGQFVVGGNYIVGFVLFLALIAIQFLVISHGAVRTAEVTARFTLDAMPGKQMAIDADLNAGLINEQQARARRERVAREAEFCGAMDGAARFSQRDSLATILIMAINIIAGFLIGVFQQGVPFQEALKTYTILTVGDGLVTILPSLLVSVAGGIVVTRAASKESLGVNVGRQLFNSPRLLWIAGGALTALGLIPGLPKIAFFSLAGVLFFAAWKIKPQLFQDEVDELEMMAKAALPGGPAAPTAIPWTQLSSSTNSCLKWDWGWCLWSMSRGRPTARPRKIDAQESGPAARLSGSLHPHHGQPVPEGTGICDLPARGRDRSMGAAPRLSAGYQFQLAMLPNCLVRIPVNRPSMWPPNGSHRRPRDRPLLRDMQWCAPHVRIGRSPGGSNQAKRS